MLLWGCNKAEIKIVHNSKLEKFVDLITNNFLVSWRLQVIDVRVQKVQMWGASRVYK